VTRAFGACAAALMRGGFLRWEAVKAEVHRPYAHEEMFWRMAHFRRLGLRLLAPCLSACPAVAAGDESYVMRVWVAAMVEVEQVGGAAARTVHGGTLDHRSARSGFNCVCVCVCTCTGGGNLQPRVIRRQATGGGPSEQYAAAVARVPTLRRWFAAHEGMAASGGRRAAAANVRAMESMLRALCDDGASVSDSSASDASVGHAGRGCGGGSISACSAWA